MGGVYIASNMHTALSNLHTCTRARSTIPGDIMQPITLHQMNKSRTAQASNDDDNGVMRTVYTRQSYSSARAISCRLNSNLVLDLERSRFLMSTQQQQ